MNLSKPALDTVQMHLCSKTSSPKMFHMKYNIFKSPKDKLLFKIILQGGRLCASVCKR